MSLVDFRSVATYGEPMALMTFGDEREAQDFTAWLNVDAHGRPTELRASYETTAMLDDGNAWTVSALARSPHHAHMLWVTFYCERHFAA